MTVIRPFDFPSVYANWNPPRVLRQTGSPAEFTNDNLLFRYPFSEKLDHP
jgi:hypothetical protein